ncbi:uncharacterized protein CCOS01_08576 [Colletotrichum costaricense]|uniref:Heterokaryon incompatibility domain-containing protein n=1 Tax=Colletotrichum costaricense TaxID=1209916 RepID=A0AAI9YWU1_9PEZI|nr:uncharacterized protein CCOS01_08576 [Colletotrichum costaricense]KAK1526158.1 hypothetical protein CCOS01_08576 [Colletotrichum costaricense]
MGEIYRCVETVHVWLGDVDADEVAVAFANIRMVHAIPAATEPSRMEIKLADRAVLRYGEHCVEYARFRAAWYLVESHLLTQGNLGYLRHLLRRDTTDDLLELLWGFHTAKCSDPRDSLAALHCFLPQSEQQIDLQYGQIGWKEMHRRLAERYINKGTLSASRVILRLFAFGPAAGRSLDDAECPSWVPDWSGVRQLGMASGDLLVDCLESIDRGDKPWIDCSDEMGDSKTEGPYSEPYLNDNLFGVFGSVKTDSATKFSAGQKKLRVRWSPIRDGLYGRSAGLVLRLPRELVVKKEKLWKHVLSCLEPIKDERLTLSSWRRVTTLFAFILRSKDIVSEDKDHPSRWSFKTLTSKMYKALWTGFVNPESLAREQILLLTLIGSVLQRFALVVLHPLPYIWSSTGWYDRPSLEQEYGLAPHDMDFGDIFIPFDVKNPQDSPRDRWIFMYCEEPLVEVSICLRPMSPKLVYEVSDISQDMLSLPWDQIAAMVGGSQKTYRDRPDDPEFPYPPSHVRTARFLGPAYCVTRSSDTVFTAQESKSKFVQESKVLKDYRDACAAGLCRPLNIDIV